VLITGACGLLGAHLTAALSRGYRVTGVDRHPWWGDQPVELLIRELSAPGVVPDLIRSITPEMLIHCAAMVDVEACERQPELAFACNAGLTRTLVRSVGPDCLFVYISTDSLFHGTAPFVTEAEAPSPKTAYARSKFQGEQEVAQATPNHLIVRTNVYGWSSSRKETSAEWLYRCLHSDERIRLFTDIFFTPIYVVDVVERLSRLLESGFRGLIHLAGRDRVSKYEFGSLLAAAAGFRMQHVQRASVDRSGLTALRPKEMSLSSQRFQSVTGLDLPGCLEGLQRFLVDRERPLNARVAGLEVTAGRLPPREAMRPSVPSVTE